MKKLLTLLSIIAIATATTSCVQDDDFTVPSSLGDEENNNLQMLLENATEMSFADVKAMYDNDPNNDGDNADAMPFEVDTDIYVKGYVSSSDKTGNFFKEFFIQDNTEAPSSGLKIIINQVDTYNQFNFGREVYINLKGLFIGEERTGNGVTTIGGGTETDQYGTTVTRLNNNQVNSNVLRLSTTAELTPLQVSFPDINDNLLGVFIEVNGVEFADDLEGKRYFDPVQEFDTQRTLQTCGGFDYSNFQLETSSFADFKNEMLPTGNGSLKAVINKTFDGASLVLALNSTDDVNLAGERCTPLNPEDFTTIFEEDFQSVTNNTDLDLTNWTNFAEEGGWVWREKTFDGNGYTEFSTYNSGDDVNIAWLVTPGFNMDAQNNEFLNFKSAQHHLDSPDNTLEVFVSTDYNGTDVLSATWEPISATLASQNNDWYDFIDSGLVDISNYSGTLYVAFKVTGSGNDTVLDGAYQIDDVSIIATN